MPVVSATRLWRVSARPRLSRSMCSRPQSTVGRSLGFASRPGSSRNTLRSTHSSITKPLSRNSSTPCRDEGPPSAHHKAFVEEQPPPLPRRGDPLCPQPRPPPVLVRLRTLVVEDAEPV